MKPIQTKKFEAFLKLQGLEFKRIKGSHHIWDKPDDSLDRPVTFCGAKPEIPPKHIETNLKTLGIDKKDFEEIRKTL